MSSVFSILFALSSMLGLHGPSNVQSTAANQYAPLHSGGGPVGKTVESGGGPVGKSSNSGGGPVGKGHNSGGGPVGK